MSLLLPFIIVPFIIVPLVELFLLVRIGEAIGALPTIGICIVTGIAGASLARWQGALALARFRAAASAGRVPDVEIVEGLLILIAAIVLLTPGVLTDATGLLLLLPWPRRYLAKRLIAGQRSPGGTWSWRVGSGPLGTGGFHVGGLGDAPSESGRSTDRPPREDQRSRDEPVGRVIDAEFTIDD